MESLFFPRIFRVFPEAIQQIIWHTDFKLVVDLFKRVASFQGLDVIIL